MSNVTIKFSTSDNAFAYQLYQGLKGVGVTDSDFDAGSVVTNESGTECKNTSDAACRIGQKDGAVTAEEVMEYAFDRYEQYQSIIEGAATRKLPWVLTDVTEPKIGAEVRARIEQYIAKVKAILSNQDLKEGTPLYQEKLALSLYFLVLTPDKDWIKNNKERFDFRTKELKEAGCSQVLELLVKDGGLRTDNSAENAGPEYTALEALQKGKGECTEMSYILYALFKMAGFSPILYVGYRAGMLANKSDPEESAFLKTLPIGYGHMCVGLKIDDKIRLFDPAFIDSNANYTGFYPLTPRQAFAQYLSNDAHYWLNNQDRSSAKKIYKQALLVDSRTIPALVGYSGVLDNENEKLKILSRAIEIDPKNAVSYYNRGVFYRHKLDFTSAIRDYSRAIELDPATVEAYINRGAVYVLEQQWEAAAQDFSKILEINPQLIIAELKIGHVWLQAGNERKAMQAFGRFLQASGNANTLLDAVENTPWATTHAEKGNVKIRTTDFENDTGGLSLPKIDLLFLFVSAFWRAQDRKASEKMLQMVLDSLDPFKKKPSPSTSAYFDDVLKSLPTDMATDDKMKELIEILKTRVTYQTP